MVRLFLALGLVTTTTSVVTAWQPTLRPSHLIQPICSNSNHHEVEVMNHDDLAPSASTSSSRRHVLFTGLTAAFAATWSTSSTSPALALVKGNAPPPQKGKPTSDKLPCSNVEECQALAEAKQAEEAAVAAADAVPTKVTARGTRYLDLKGGDGVEIKEGDNVVLHYKVFKAGKRSYDGLSGEGTVIFSRGYGLEDDETGPGTKGFVTIVGATTNIAALNDALLGVREGGIRRFAVLPDKGWRKPGKECDGGPGGSGAGGDLKTDYVVVPTATMVASEACFDSTKLPFPESFAQQRRMAQRFDQSLIMEVEVVTVDSQEEELLNMPLL